MQTARNRTVSRMRAVVALSAVLVMVFSSIGIGSIARAAGERDLTPTIEQGSTDRFGGGDWIGVRAGDARVGVVYGTVNHPNHLYVLAEYKRFLGGAEVYDGRDNYLRTVPIPVYTIFGQSFAGLLEFQDRNGDGLLDYNRYPDYRNDTQVDLPVKATSLARAWTATVPTEELEGNITWVNFTVSTTRAPYGIVWDALGPRRGLPKDGFVDQIAFTFHLKIQIRPVSGEVPWYKVTIDTTGPRPLGTIDFLGNRSFSGDAVAMGAKYDHLIEGWNFTAPTNRLALETRAFLGHYVPDRVAQFVHRLYHSEANGTTVNRTHRVTENDTAATTPTPLTPDYVYFDDEWSRATDLVGRLVWTSNVTVDGQPTLMQFQVQGGERFGTYVSGAGFFGFAVHGAYIYPAGAVIFHDPQLEAVSNLWNLPGTLNLTPFTIVAIQAAIAAFALAVAVLFRVKGRRGKQLSQD